jgi:hypothetical protein
VLAPREPYRLERRSWISGETNTVTATYVVPKGFRREEARLGRDAQFYGYVVRVYYRDSLLDADARPKTLLDALTADQPAKGARTDAAAARAAAADAPLPPRAEKPSEGRL